MIYEQYHITRGRVHYFNRVEKQERHDGPRSLT
jgi:hypothetical protein